MTDQSKVLDRIRKVLAKAEGTDNAAEADMLMAKVTAMLEEHNLSLLDVGKGDSADPIGTNHDAAHCWVSNSWVQPVASVLAKLYGCRVVVAKIRNKIYFSISGRESGRVTWDLMLPFVLAQVRAEAKRLRDKDIMEIVQTTSWDYDRAARQTKGVGAYERAVGNALAFRINKMAKESAAKDAARVANGERALVPVDLVEAELTAAHGNLTTARASTLRTTSAAREAAGRVSLHRQTGGSATLKLN